VGTELNVCQVRGLSKEGVAVRVAVPASAGGHGRAVKRPFCIQNQVSDGVLPSRLLGG